MLPYMTFALVCKFSTGPEKAKRITYDRTTARPRLPKNCGIISNETHREVLLRVISKIKITTKASDISTDTKTDNFKCERKKENA